MKRRAKVLAVIAAVLWVSAGCSKTVDEPCAWCGNSPSVEYESSSGEKVYVWKLLDQMVVDVSEFSKEQANAVLAWLWDFRVPDGFYSVYLNLGESLLNTKFRVEDIDVIALTEFIKESVVHV